MRAIMNSKIVSRQAQTNRLHKVERERSMAFLNASLLPAMITVALAARLKKFHSERCFEFTSSPKNNRGRRVARDRPLSQRPARGGAERSETARHLRIHSATH
ncbi:hypothetical protein EVAR_26860_1 [Eumeta japonica]|uniref:Uncharacterized protein n=1 Tax=Eumeta variegata TaxID=151549 RepID=A0A4C1VZ22_EUMVA|nr:hypothetical protein EVAR_26860_1 [Eumeta japonica]